MNSPKGIIDDLRLLGIKTTPFTAIELKAAYRMKAKEVHPDKTGDAGGGSGRGSGAEFIALHAAYKRMIAYVGKTIDVGGLSDEEILLLILMMSNVTRRSKPVTSWFGIGMNMKWKK